jgi:hypothetical protein
MKQRQKTVYNLAFYSTGNVLLETFSGDLLHCVARAALRVENMDNYYKVRRQLLLVGGAYTSFFMCKNTAAQRLIRVCIVSSELEREDRLSKFAAADFQRLFQNLS